MRLRFSKATLQGDFFNAIRVRQIGGGFGPNGPSREPPKASGANLVLTLSDSTLQGVVSSARARHLKSPIGAADYQWLGRVTNTSEPAVNNGVVVRLQRSTWTVTGVSHLTALEIGEGAVLQGPDGRALRLQVNGADLNAQLERALDAGTGSTSH